MPVDMTFRAIDARASTASEAFLPGPPTMTLDPALVLIIFLPPLLMDGAWFIALGPLRRHMIGIAALAVGAVLFTTFVVAVATHALMPALP
jgi:NhaP-type Na+/H+ or K+/H+ antiporter